MSLTKFKPLSMRSHRRHARLAVERFLRSRVANETALNRVNEEVLEDDLREDDIDTHDVTGNIVSRLAVEVEPETEDNFYQGGGDIGHSVLDKYRHNKGIINTSNVQAVGCSDSACSDNDYYTPDCSSDEGFTNSRSTNNDNNCKPDLSLREDLADWAVAMQIPHTALAKLLGILLKHGHPELPKDPRTLLQTNTSYKCEIKDIPGGSYYHFGIKEGILSKLDMHAGFISVSDLRSISLLINIDGLPLFKSSASQFWPILGMIKELPKKDPFIIGLFYGNSKPADVSIFLHAFISEMQLLERSEISHGGQFYKISISSIICDTPARAFVKNVKGHSGYFGCDKCTQKGFYTERRVTFPEINAPLRQDRDFKNIKDFEEHHNGPCPWLDLKLGMVTQFPLDYMHLVCLGVMRRLLVLWRKGPLITRLSTGQIQIISGLLTRLRTSVPREFARKPRSLTDLDRWKATEFRQLLLYTGPVVLSNILPQPQYRNFMLLAIAIRIFLSPDLCIAYLDCAHQLLEAFVRHFSELYGKEMLSYNVHGLVHLAEEVRLHGCLENISAFPFENFLGKLKRLIRSPTNPLPQVIRRMSEKSTKAAGLSMINVVKQEHFNGPLFNFQEVTFTSYKQYKQLYLSFGCITSKEGDNCVKIGDNLFLVRNIFVIDCIKYVLVEKFRQRSSFCGYPFPLESMGIYQVSRLSGICKLETVSDIICKYVLLPTSDKCVALPLPHSPWQL